MDEDVIWFCEERDRDVMYTLVVEGLGSPVHGAHVVRIPSQHLRRQGIRARVRFRACHIDRDKNGMQLVHNR